MKEIQRDLYLSQLKKKMGNGLVKVVAGVRRCGKSCLLFNLFRRYLLSTGVKPGRIIALSLEDDENEDYQDPAKLSWYLKSQIKGDGETYYILLDEAQLAITEAERRGKGTIKLYGILNTPMNRGNVDVYVTGNNSRFLSSDILTEFRGRSDEIRTHP